MLAALPSTLALIACLTLVLAGSAIQVAVGAGLSVVCGPFLLLWLGPVAVPILLLLNLLVSVIATARGGRSLRWPDVACASAATLAGCALASLLPGLPDAVLKALTAAVLLAVALPPPPSGNPSAFSAAIGLVVAGLLTGAVTVWTATPGPILPVALARMGRSGSDIRRSMQPISIVGYGAALAWVRLPALDTFRLDALAGLVVATLIGTALGFPLRRRIDPARVVLLVRIVAAVAAALLLASLLHWSRPLP